MNIDVLRRSIYQTLIEGGKRNNVSYIEELGFNIPQDWDVAKLSDVAELNIGNTTNKFVKNKFEDNKDGIPYIATKDVLFDRTICVNGAMILPLNFCNFKIASPTSILFCKEGGSFGRKISIVNQECYFGNKLVNIDSKSSDNEVANKYLYFVLQSSYFFNEVNSRKTGIISGINKEQLGSIYVPVPTEKEMKSIVSLLEKVEIKINELEENYYSINRLIDSYEELLLPSIYQYALQGKLVSNIYSDDYGVDVESSIIREGDKYFEVINGEKVDITSDISFETPSNYQWFRLGDIAKFRTTKESDMGEQIIINANLLRKKGIVDYAKKGKFVYKGEMIILMDGSNSGELFEVPKDGYLGSTFSVLEIESDYKEYILKFIRMSKNILSGNKRGAAIPHLDKKLFNSLLIPLPPLAEQKEIVNKIKEIEEIINEVE